MITVTTIINVPLQKVWEYWTKEEHVKNWNLQHLIGIAPMQQITFK